LEPFLLPTFSPQKPIIPALPNHFHPYENQPKIPPFPSYFTTNKPQIPSLPSCSNDNENFDQPTIQTHTSPHIQAVTQTIVTAAVPAPPPHPEFSQPLPFDHSPIATQPPNTPPPPLPGKTFPSKPTQSKDAGPHIKPDSKDKTFLKESKTKGENSFETAASASSRTDFCAEIIQRSKNLKKSDIKQEKPKETQTQIEMLNHTLLKIKQHTQSSDEDPETDDWLPET